MKKIFAFLTVALMAISTFSLQSCDDDDNEVAVPGYALVTVKPNVVGGSFVMQFSDSLQVMASNMTLSPFGDKARTDCLYVTRRNTTGRDAESACALDG